MENIILETGEVVLEFRQRMLAKMYYKKPCFFRFLSVSIPVLCTSLCNYSHKSYRIHRFLTILTHDNTKTCAARVGSLVWMGLLSIL